MSHYSNAAKYRQIGIEITHQFKDIGLCEGEFQKILNIVSWKETPFFPHRGRMAWYIFQQEPQMADGQTRSLKAAKIKGVGGFNPPTDAQNRDPIYHESTPRPFQPTNLPLSSFATYPHLGFDKNGEFTVVFGNVAPIGGILYDRALNEYNCALHLFENNISSIVPLAVIRYEEKLKFNEQRMGVVICISPSKYPYRLSEVQFGSALRIGKDASRDEYYHLIQSSLEVLGDPNSENTRLMILRKIAYKVGRKIYHFSTSGLYRYSAELPNFEFDFIKNDVVLTDLDSSGFLKTLPQPHQRLQVLRDMASMIYHFLAKFANPLALGHYTLGNLLKHDPITELICGYFQEASKNDIEIISKKLWNYFIPHFMLINKYRNEIHTEWTTERRRSYKMDHDLFFILAIASLYPIFCKSRLSKLYPDPSLTQEEIMKRAKNYLGERFEFFEYILSGAISKL